MSQEMLEHIWVPFHPNRVVPLNPYKHPAQVEQGSQARSSVVEKSGVTQPTIGDEANSSENLSPQLRVADVEQAIAESDQPSEEIHEPVRFHTDKLELFAFNLGNLHQEERNPWPDFTEIPLDDGEVAAICEAVQNEETIVGEGFSAGERYLNYFIGTPPPVPEYEYEVYPQVSGNVPSEELYPNVQG